MNGHLPLPGDGSGSSASVPVTKTFERKFSKISFCETDDEPDEGIDSHSFVPSDPVPLKAYLERDKEDESLRRWKEQLLGCVDYSLHEVDQTRCMLGTFGPRQEPYIYISEEDTTPNGILACGTYKAKTKFVDDDGRCHLELDYSFSIQKDW